MARVGAGELTSIVEFDQAYAHRQHEDLSYKHPGGGGAKYLEKALFENVEVYMKIMSGFLERGFDLHRAAAEVAETITDYAELNAPRRPDEFIPVLRNSGHPSVEDNGTVVYDRPPRAARLSPEEIEERNMALQDPHHYYGPWPPIGKPVEKLSRTEQLRRQGKLKGKPMSLANRARQRAIREGRGRA